MSLRFYPRGNSGSREGTALEPTPTRWNIKKMLLKGLRSPGPIREEQSFIDRALKFRQAVLNEFNRLVRDRISVNQSPEVEAEEPVAFA
jgi:hypothetical protein